MDGVKGFFASRTIWGALVALLGVVLPLFGIEFSSEDGSQLLSVIDEVIVIAGTLFAMYGRIVATSRIGNSS